MSELSVKSNPDPYDWFRPMAAKDILCALLTRGETGICYTDIARKAVNIADALIDELSKDNK